MPFGKRKNSQPVNVRRRAFLKWGLAAAAATAAGITTHRVHQHIQSRRAAAEAALRTFSTRESGVSGVIESVPDIADRESSWYKPRAGVIREAHSDRGPGHVDSFPPKKGDRSHIHSHAYNTLRVLPSNLRMRFLSNPSPGDLLQMLHHASGKNPVYTAHTAAVDEYGRVLGYTSIRLSKKIQQNKNALTILRDIAERFDARYTSAIAARDWKRLHAYSENYFSELESTFGKNGSIIKNGLLIHHTGMPGFTYKNREFQEK